MHRLLSNSGKIHQNGVNGNVQNGEMPELEAEVSVFDNVPRLRGRPVTNGVTTNGHHAVNGDHDENQKDTAENKCKDKAQKIPTTTGKTAHYK